MKKQEIDKSGTQEGKTKKKEKPNAQKRRMEKSKKSEEHPSKIKNKDTP